MGKGREDLGEMENNKGIAIIKNKVKYISYNIALSSK